MKLVLKLMFAVISAFVLSTVWAVPFAPALTCVIGGGILLGKVAKINGLVLFDAIAPDLLKELEDLKTKLTEKLTKAQSDAISLEVKKLEDKIAEAAKLKGEFDTFVVKADERDKTKQKEIDEMSAEIKKLKDGGGPGGANREGITAQLKKCMDGNMAYIDDANGGVIKETTQSVKAAMADLKNGNQHGSARFILKANTDPITVTSSYSGGTIGLTDWISDYTRVPQRRPFLRDLVSVRPTSKTYVAWAEQTGIEGDAGMVAEGAAKPQNTFDTVERNMRIKKIAKFTKTSKENLDDLPYMAAEIRQELIEAVLRKLDSQILSGDGTGENLKGILEYAPDFSVAGTDLANGVINANNFDVLRAAAAQVAVNGLGNFIPNYFIINPWDAAVMDLTKTDEGIYVLPPFTTVDGRRVAGMLGVENTGVTAGEFLLGDFTKSYLALREDVVVSMGYVNADFTNNLVTILAEMRAAHFIKSNQVTAFVQGDFSVAKALLDGSVAS